jgi:hypothetical protein
MINIIQAPRASAPYPWARFAKWMAEQGFTPDEVQTMIENGVEPVVVHEFGFQLDDSVDYPGLPSLEAAGPTLDPEPAVRMIVGGQP